MRVLIVKMSSMGDIIHTLPALTDARRAIPNIEFDWVVEPHFAEIPHWHTAVNQVFAAPMRHWRKAPWQALKSQEIPILIKKLRAFSYDAVIDAQGLVKSALIAKLAKGKRYGFNYRSARESIVSLTYHSTFDVPKNQHAVERVRQLLAQALNYTLPQSAPDYGIKKEKLATLGEELSYENSVIFLHGTTWPTKHWPLSFWQQLGYLVTQSGFQVLLPWGNEIEYQRAKEIREFCQTKQIDVLPQVLPKLSLAQITSLIAKAKGIVAVDTGLGHIAAAMAVPTISLYGPTDPGLTGAYGPLQTHLQANFSCAPCKGRTCKKGQNFAVMPPCFESLPPEKIWHELMNTICDVKN